MGYINAFLMQMSLETAQRIYNGFMVLCVVIYVPYLWYISRHYTLDKKDRWLTFVICPIFCVTTPFLAFGADNGKIVQRSSANGILLGLLLGMIASKIMGKSMRRCCDIVMPLAIASRTILIMGCFFVGCCYGEAVEWGLFSRMVGTTVIPLQSIEVIVCVGIFCKAMIELKRRNYPGDGAVGSYMLMAFGVLRFVTDLFRPHPKLFGRTALDGVMGIVMVFAGAMIFRSYEVSTAVKVKSKK